MVRNGLGDDLRARVGTADALLAESGVFEPALAEMHEAAHKEPSDTSKTGWPMPCPGASRSPTCPNRFMWWGDDDQTVRRECASTWRALTLDPHCP
jgi:hypothetical protein